MKSREVYILSDNTEIILDTKLVGSIDGKFYVPSYQRGYRWGEDEVKRLLEDISANGANNYCLQPVVVRRDGDRYELIDGQQRLTTIYLIYKYMHAVGGQFMPEPKFSITYETREKSEEFLNNIDLNLKEENIDFWFMCQAYEAIDTWFKEQGNISSFLEISSYLEKNVKIIWYEVGANEDPIALFTRLNIGKIPLTSAELVKAMFLSRDENNMSRERQEEISLQWDNTEKELHNDSLWYFLTNDISEGAYQTRIDLVLDLIAKKPQDSKDKNYTFFKFDEIRKQEKDLIKVWNKIQRTFLVLKDWYEDHTLYHKIGYLIASDFMTLQDVYNLSEGKTKVEFANSLDDKIRESIDLKQNYADLSYEDSAGYRKISTLLLLFNVESVRKIDGEAQRFPFDKFKNQKGRVTWSLEHIHAQQSEGLKTMEVWKKWLELHIPSVEVLDGDNTALIDEMRGAIESPKLERNDFDSIRERVAAILSAPGSIEYMHCISNLALLNSSDNAALNNATFDVKRNEIIEMDKKGQYIPFCTKMVFLKYYTQSKDNQIHFWGPADRIAYVNGINDVLEPYLKEKISVEKEVME